MIRDARLDDVPAIRQLICQHAELDRMLFRSLSDLYESLRDFKVCLRDEQVVGCVALDIVWSDLAELRSLAVDIDHQGQGIGSEMVRAVVAEARELRLNKVFTLTLEGEFFLKQDFVQVPMDSLPMKVWSDCVACPKQDHCDEIALAVEISQ